MKPKPTSRPPTPRRIPRRVPPRRTTLEARAASSEEEFDDYEGESEPNMRLSHAFIVVLALHVLAVGGVFAFNSLKTRPGVPETVTKAAPAAPQAAPKVETTAAKPAPAKPPAAAPASASADASAVTYTVVAGDTLTKIASAHKMSVAQIEVANDLEIGATIRVGQTLRIPSGDVPKVTTSAAKPVAAVPKTVETTPVVAKPVEVKPAAPKPSAAPVADSGKTYVVAKGDNPYSIAKKLKVSYTELIKANKIDDPTKLQIGQTLVVP